MVNNRGKIPCLLYIHCFYCMLFLFNSLWVHLQVQLNKKLANLFLELIWVIWGWEIILKQTLVDLQEDLGG